MIENAICIQTCSLRANTAQRHALRCHFASGIKAHNMSWTVFARQAFTATKEADLGWLVVEGHNIRVTEDPMWKNHFCHRSQWDNGLSLLDYTEQLRESLPANAAVPHHFSTKPRFNCRRRLGRAHADFRAPRNMASHREYVTTFSVWQLIASIGGTMGIWTGSIIVSLIHLAYFHLFLCNQTPVWARTCTTPGAYINHDPWRNQAIEEQIQQIRRTDDSIKVRQSNRAFENYRWNAW